MIINSRNANKARLPFLLLLGTVVPFTASAVANFIPSNYLSSSYQKLVLLFKLHIKPATSSVCPRLLRAAPGTTRSIKKKVVYLWKFLLRVVPGAIKISK